MEATALLLAWAAAIAPNVPMQLAAGTPLTLPQTHNLTNWLRARSGIAATSAPPEKAHTYNATVIRIREFIRWCLIVGNAENQIAMDSAIKASDRIWRMMGTMPVTAQEFADDLEDDEIRAIETFLHGLAFPPAGPANPVHVRDYLMWRLAIEYGLRIGEILALRDKDLPTREANHLRIVRTDQRGDDVDPRGARAPQVKTLGRDLGCYFRNTAFPGLFNRYLSEHRWVWARRKSGAQYQKTRFGHGYLLVSTTDGSPLSMSSAAARARWIAKETGVNFHWHACRHSFFNRAYVAMERLKDRHEYAKRRAGLVYWGGWSNPDSLDIYTRTAQRNRARSASFDLHDAADQPTWGALE